MAVIARGLGGLQDLRRRLTGVKSMAGQVAKNIAPALMKAVADEFRTSTGPYGDAWAPVVRNRKRDRRARGSRAARGLAPKADKPLIDTGRLRASVTATVSGDEVRVALPVEYASYHQDGTRHIPRRQILPDPGSLGPKWAGIIEKETRRVLDEHFRGGK